MSISQFGIKTVKVAVFFHIAVLLTACQSHSNHQEFTSKLGQAHAYSREKEDQGLLEEPIRPLPKSLVLNGQKVKLGERLFHERRLSRDDTVSCASCHILEQGGDDNSRVSTGVGGVKGEINSPTVLNSGLNFAQFWNGRASSLESQAEGPVHNPVEMASNWEQVTGKLSQDPEYLSTFDSLYAGELSGENIVDAIAEYERSLITESPFDRYLRGQSSSISSDAKAGYEKFKSYGCVSCHQGVNVGGNMFQKFGALMAYFEDKAYTDSDRGREAVTGDKNDLHIFKVPSLRNVAKTAPYFHNGSAQTLEQAIKVMAGLQLGRSIPEQDILKIKAFLQSLSGDTKLL